MLAKPLLAKMYETAVVASWLFSSKWAFIGRHKAVPHTSLCGRDNHRPFHRPHR